MLLIKCHDCPLAADGEPCPLAGKPAMCDLRRTHPALAAGLGVPPVCLLPVPAPVRTIRLDTDPLPRVVPLSSSELAAQCDSAPTLYFARERLAAERVTLFVGLSGRAGAWASHLRPFLDGQTWPRDRVRLVLADTSQRPDFSRTIKEWLDHAGYPDSLYYTQTVGVPGLNALPRPDDGGVEVNAALRRIYARMAAELTTRFVLVVEDDHRPPPGTIERLLRGMDDRTAAVSALYRGRSPDGHWVAWSDRRAEVRPCPGPAVPIAGSGFGTLLLAREWLWGETFEHQGLEPFPYDIGFSFRVRARGGVWKLDRSVLSDHAGAPPLPGPETLETAAEWEARVALAIEQARLRPLPPLPAR